MSNPTCSACRHTKNVHERSGTKFGQCSQCECDSYKPRKAQIFGNRGARPGQGSGDKREPSRRNF